MRILSTAAACWTRHWLRLMALILLLPATAGTAAGTLARAPTASDLVDLHQMDDVQLSPDGTHMAITVKAFPPQRKGPSHPEPAVFVLPDVEYPQLRRLTPEGRAAHTPRWSRDGSRLALFMQDETGKMQLFVFSPDGEQREQVTSFDGGITGSPPLAWSPDGKQLAFATPDPDAMAAWRNRAPKVASSQQPRRRLWTVDLPVGEARPVTPATLDVEAIAWAPDSLRLAMVGKMGDEKGSHLLTVGRDGRKLSALSENAVSPGSRDQTLDWSPDGGRILFGVARTPGGVERWLGVIPAAGGEVRHLLPDYPGHVMRAVWRPGSEGLLAQAFTGLTSRLLRVQPEAEDVEEIHAFQAAYPRFSVSADGQRVAYLGEAHDAPANVHLFEMVGTARRLTDLNPQLRELDLGRVEAISWHNHADGLELEGLLITPGNGHQPPYPLVVQLHGGPHFHWAHGWLGGWNDWAQWLAPRGYAVFLPNPRGSTGRGWVFAKAIHDRLGDPDGDDVLAGVEALVERGLADPDRLYIAGHSYGGFLTAWLLTRTGRFRAGIVNAGISDLVSFAGTAGLREYWSMTYFPDGVHRRMDAYRDRSPLSHLHQVTTPTLVLHGEEDAKIPASQGWQLYSGLRNLGVESELVIYPGAGHALSERSQQIHLLEAVLGWLVQHGGPS